MGLAATPISCIRRQWLRRHGGGRTLDRVRTSRHRRVSNFASQRVVSGHMMTRGLLACLALSATVSAQSRPPFDAAQGAPSVSRGAEFEVASVRNASDQPNQVTVGMRITDSQVRISYLSLKDYIGMAYNLRP